MDQQPGAENCRAGQKRMERRRGVQARLADMTLIVPSLLQVTHWAIQPIIAPRPPRRAIRLLLSREE